MQLAQVGHIHQNEIGGSPPGDRREGVRGDVNGNPRRGSKPLNVVAEQGVRADAQDCRRPGEELPWHPITPTPS